MASMVAVKMTALPVGVQVLIVAGDSMELAGINTEKTIGDTAKYIGAPNGVYPLNVVAGNTLSSYAFEHEGKYLSFSGTKGTLSESATLNDKSSWKVSFSDGNATITNVDNLSYTLQYNASTPRFACYSSSQKPVQLIRAGKQVTKWITNCCTPQPFAVRDTTVLIDNSPISFDLLELIDGAGNGGDKEFSLVKKITAQMPELFLLLLLSIKRANTW